MEEGTADLDQAILTALLKSKFSFHFPCLQWRYYDSDESGGNMLDGM